MGCSSILRVLVVAVSQGFETSKDSLRVLDGIGSRVAVIPVLLHSLDLLTSSHTLSPPPSPFFPIPPPHRASRSPSTPLPG